MLNLKFDFDFTVILVTACICATLCFVVKSGCDYETAKHKNYVEAGYVESSTPSSYTTVWTKAEVKRLEDKLRKIHDLTLMPMDVRKVVDMVVYDISSPLGNDTNVPTKESEDEVESR